MDRYSRETRCWLDLRFDPEALAACGHAYEPYQPVGGLAPDAWTPGAYLMASRWIRLVHFVRTLAARSFLDVGGAEGHTSWLVGRATGIEAASADLSIAASRRAREFFGDATLAAEAHRLPFADDAFDVVYLGEVIEHLANPLPTLLELQRVARLGIVVTSEACVPTEAARRVELAERAYQEHMDRSILCPHDFELLMPDWALTMSNQCASLPDPVPTSREALARSFAETLTSHGIDPPAHGLFVAAGRSAAPSPPDASIARDIEAVLDLVAPAARERSVQDAALPDALAARLRCPRDGTPLADVDGDLACDACGRRFPVVDGVPDLVEPAEEPAPDLAARLGAAFPDDPERVATALELDALLRYELPAARTETAFLAQAEPAWHPGPGVQLQPLDGRGLLVRATAEDPCLFSPRLDRPLSAVAAVQVTLRARRAAAETETVQLFVKTLHRPLWWELGSTTLEWRTDGSLQELRIPLPPADRFPPDDELLALRLDPSHQPADIEIHGLQLLG